MAKPFAKHSGKTKDDYISVFYNFNLIKDNGFENYSVGANLEDANVTAENWYEKTDNGASDMEFWCDEFFAQGSDAHWKDGVGMQMTQFAAGLTAAMNTGVDSLVSWQLFDTNWLSTGTNKEFVCGIHAVGTCPSLAKVNDTCQVENCNCKDYNEYSSYTPRVTYYGINLLGKYLNNKNADVYSTSVANNLDTAKGGIYVSSIKAITEALLCLL